MGGLFRPRTLLPGFLLPFLAGALPLPAQDDDRDEREAPEVRSLDFRGVRAVDEDELRESIATRATRCRSLLLQPLCWVSDADLFVEKQYLDRTELRRDILRMRLFYWRRGYREATVDTTVGRRDDGVAIRFRVREGRPTLVSSVSVLQSDSALSDRQISGSMLLRAGEPLDLLALDSSLVLLRNALWNEGYADAEIRDTVIANDSLLTGAVRIEVNPRWQAQVGEIRVRGNRKVAERTIRNSLSFRVGDVYRRDDVMESQRSLYSSNLFSHAVIIVPPQGDSIKIIEITVQEAPLREARASAGFNTVDFFQVEGRFTNYNFYGRARRLDIRGVVGNLLASTLNGEGFFRDVTPPTLGERGENAFLRPNWQGGVSVTQPWFGSSRNTLGGELFAHRRSAPGIFIDRGYGGALSFTRNLANRAPASITYRYESTEVEAGDVYFCVNYGVCELATVGALRARNALSPLALSIFTDRTNDPLDPRVGYSARADAEHASAFTASDYRYNRVAAEAAIYRPIGRRNVLAARARIGWVGPLRSTVDAVGAAISGDADERILHPRRRFYAGGSQSVRGYGENQLGPRILVIDPERLTDSALGNPCTDASLADGTCDPNVVGSSAFQPRALGGTSLLEGSVEFRFPVWKELSGAVFVDGAFVGQGALGDVTEGAGAITPGVGIRYRSPVGPIRVDLGFRPRLAERLSVITEVTDADGARRIVRLRTAKRYDPLGDPLDEEPSGISKLLERLTLHLSIGQAF